MFLLGELPEEEFVLEPPPPWLRLILAMLRPLLIGAPLGFLLGHVARALPVWLKVPLMSIGCFVIALAHIIVREDILYLSTRSENSGEKMENQKSELKLELKNVDVLGHMHGDVLKALLEANMHLYPEISRLSWKLSLVESSVVNAHVGSDGEHFAEIGVYAGLLKVCNSAEEFALVFGHEVAHVLLSHHEEYMIRLARMLFSAMANGAIFRRIYPALISAALTVMLVHLALTLPISREQELEADTLGLQLAARAGFNVTNAAGLLRKRYEANLQSIKSFKLPTLLYTHPSCETRVANLQKILRRLRS